MTMQPINTSNKLTRDQNGAVMSWIIYRLSDGSPMLETWNFRTVLAVNLQSYGWMTALEWLQGISTPEQRIITAKKHDYRKITVDNHRNRR